METAVKIKLTTPADMRAALAVARVSYRRVARAWGKSEQWTGQLLNGERRCSPAVLHELRRACAEAIRTHGRNG